MNAIFQKGREYISSFLCYNEKQQMTFKSLGLTLDVFDTAL